MTEQLDLNESVKSIMYAIFLLGASKDDEFNETETREHLFKLWELLKYLIDYDKK